MKSDNKFLLTVNSNSVNESFVRVTVSAFVAQLDPTIDELCDIKTAVSEAVTNCTVHAYKNTIGKIFITCEILNNRTVTVKVRDRGCGIPDIKKAMQPMFTTGGSERAGLGFAVMENFMDKITVRSKVSKGTTVILKKKLSPRVAQNG